MHGSVAHCSRDASRSSLLRRRVGASAPGRRSSISFRLAAGSSRSAGPMRVMAMQGGWSPQPQQPQQPLQPLQPQQPVRQPAPLARQQYPAAPVFLELSQVLNKQVVTRTSGRSLGSISGAWLDPARGSLVSFDLDERRSGSGGSGLGLSSPARAGNIPLSALRQIGDVVLVHDEGGLYEQDLDGRLGFVNPLGLDVRTASGEFLGKVRDLSFSPDSGAISRITYDEFGLPFLPLSFFDCYSVALADVLSIGRSDLIVYDDAKYRERRESAGLFAAIPSLLKSLNAPRLAAPQLALPAPGGGTSDMYRLGAGGVSGSSRYLPADYTYEQWQADLRRWEAETGMTYEQYLRSQPQQQPAAPRTTLPPGRPAPTQQGYAAPGYGQGVYAAPQQQQQQQQPRQQLGYAQAPLQPQQPQQPQQYGQVYGQPIRPQQVPGQQQQPQQPQQPQQQPSYGSQAAAWGAAAAAQQAPAANQYGAGAYNAAAAGPGAAAGPAAAPGMPGLQQRGQQQLLQPRRSQVQQQQPQQPQQQQAQQPVRAAGVAAAGTARTAAPRLAAAAPQAAQQQQQPGTAQQQQQQPQQQPGMAAQQAGRRVDKWMVRETRPRIADALADGVLPLTDEAGNATGSGSSGDLAQQQQQPMQQEVA